jgi:hypothetical protein
VPLAFLVAPLARNCEQGAGVQGCREQGCRQAALLRQGCVCGVPSHGSQGRRSGGNATEHKALLRCSALQRAPDLHVGRGHTRPRLQGLS